MADNGKLYPAFDEGYVEAMKTLAFSADVILPNITEACFLTVRSTARTTMRSISPPCLTGFRQRGKTIVLTGVGYAAG